MRKYLFLVFQHGSHGRTRDFRYLKAAVTRSQPCGYHNVTCWETQVNEGHGTDAGLHVCCDRCFGELRPALHGWIKATRKADPSAGLHLSLVGHSFGGLILRDIARRIHDDEVCQKAGLLFNTYCSLASPHIGVAKINPVLRVGAKLVGRICSQAYLDMLGDSTALADITSESHLCALKRFDRRLLFACMGDHLVPWESSTLGVKEEIIHPLVSHRSSDGYSDDDNDGQDARKDERPESPARRFYNKRPVYSVKPAEAPREGASGDVCTVIDSGCSQADLAQRLRAVGDWDLHVVEFGHCGSFAVPHDAILGKSKVYPDFVFQPARFQPLIDHIADLVLLSR